MSWLDYELQYLGDAAQIGWNHPDFSRIKSIIQEEMDFLCQSVQVESGAKCLQCKSTATYTYQQQVRSADEGFTSFTICFNCNHRSRDN